MATREKNASECIRTSLQYYPENIAHKYDKNVHNQVLLSGRWSRLVEIGGGSHRNAWQDPVGTDGRICRNTHVRRLYLRIEVIHNEKFGISGRRLCRENETRL